MQSAPTLVYSLPFLLPSLFSHVLAWNSPSSYLNVTTITTNNKKESILQCWRTFKLEDATTPGIAGSQIVTLPAVDPPPTYFVNPPGLVGGLHNAPVVQFISFASGSITFTFPKNAERATVKGGLHGLILATDLASTGSIGHYANYAKHTMTSGVALPVKGNVIPEHEVLHGGACEDDDLI